MCWPRELGIPAVVGCGDATSHLKDGTLVTVSCAEGDTGKIYDGLIETEVTEVKRGEMPEIKTKIMMNVGNPQLAFDFAQLPNAGVGLARLEFIINNNIGVHPKAILDYPAVDSDLKKAVESVARGHASPRAFYVDKVAEGVATIAAAFWPKPVIVRMSDFKSNEYRKLIGGSRYEPEEENPMLGFRGAARYISEDFGEAFKMECEALRRVREDMGLTNVQIMIPFVRTLKQAERVTELLAENGLKRGENELKLIMMCEVPSNAILADEKKVRAIVKEELLEIKEKFNDPRRTELAAVEGEVDIEDLIPQEECVVTLTHFGYLKRQPLDVYKTQRRGGRGISGMSRRDEDFVSEIYTCSTHDYLMFFTNKGKVYRIKGYEIPEGSRSSRGTNVVNILPLEQEEKITCVIKTGDIAAEDKYYVMVTRHGVIKRTEYNAYMNVRKSGLIAINLDEGDELAWVKITGGSDDIILATEKGMSIRFNEQDARSMGRTARGVKAITLEEGDEVIGMVVAEAGKDILTVSRSGLGRRTDLSEYRLQSRGGKGLRNYYCDKNGPVAGFEKVDDNNDIMLITDSGVIIRIPADQISQQSRYAGGVKVMKVDNETSIIGIAAVEKDDESEGSSSPNADAFAEGKAEAESDALAAEAVLPQGTEQEREQIDRLLDAATREDEE